MPDTPAPIMPHVQMLVDFDPGTGAVQISHPNDLTLALWMLAQASKTIADKQFERHMRSMQARVETAGSGLLRSLPPVNGTH